MLLSFLSELDINLTFARNGMLNPSLLRADELHHINNNLLKNYPSAVLLNISKSEVDKYVSVIKVKVLLVGTKFMFILQLPILSPTTFNFYHLLPIPNKNHTIVLPPLPFLLWSRDTYHYSLTECQD